jgi:Tol biopolymer transport system component
MEIRTLLFVATVVSAIFRPDAEAFAQVELISKAAIPSPIPSNGASTDARVSASGRYVVFTTWANNIVDSEATDFTNIVLVDRTTSTRSMISRSGASSGNGDSANADISSDGNLVVFASAASNLVADDINGHSDIFVYNRALSSLNRIVPGDGREANGDSSMPRISADGSHVAFLSKASNWVVGDSNGKTDVFVVDLASGVFARASIGLAGAEPDDDIQAPSISNNGQCVAFITLATNMVAGDSNGMADVFVRNLPAATTQRANTAADGTQADDSSYTAAVGPDCSFVVFDGSASNLVVHDTPFFFAAFEKTLSTGAIEQVYPPPIGAIEQGQAQTVSLSRNGAFMVASTFDGILLLERATHTATVLDSPQDFATDISDDGEIIPFATRDRFGAVDRNTDFDVGAYRRSSGAREQLSTGSSLSLLAANGTSGLNDLDSPLESGGASRAQYASADGNLVVFASIATNLVVGDSNGYEDVFLRDRAAGTTTLISRPPGGGVSNGDSSPSDISPDGRYIVFESCADNLVVSDTNGVCDLFVADRVANSIERINVSSSGTQVTPSPRVTGGHWASISADGRYVAFASTSALLVAGDTNNQADIFLRDRVANTTARVSNGFGGVQSTSPSSYPRISRDGRFVVFRSAGNLLSPPVPGSQIYLVEIATGNNEIISVASDGTPGELGISERPFISADGRFVAFASTAANLVPNDTNEVEDVFLRDRLHGTTTRISLSANGSQLPDASFIGGISALSGVISFTTTIFPGFTNALHLYVSGSRRVEQLIPTPPGQSQILRAAISGNGQSIVFSTQAGTLTTQDLNYRIRDVFAVRPDTIFANGVE